MRGLHGAVQSVSSESFIFTDDGQKISAPAERSIFDRTGYETEFYEYDPRGVLLFHTVFTRNGSHLVKAEITNPASMQKSVRLYNSEGSVTETDTYDANGTLTGKTVNDPSVGKEKATVSTKRMTDGSISTIEQSADGSFKESIVKPDGTTVVHAHYRASGQQQSLPSGDNAYGDWFQTSDESNRPLEYIEEPPTGRYLRTASRYDKGGQVIETDTYDRSEKLLGQTTFRYLREDENGNWTEQEIWSKTSSDSAKLRQVIHRTITYYGNLLDVQR